MFSLSFDVIAFAADTLRHFADITLLLDASATLPLILLPCRRHIFRYAIDADAADARLRLPLCCHITLFTLPPCRLLMPRFTLFSCRHTSLLL